MTEIHERDYGWRINITIKDQDGAIKDLSSCSSVQILLSRPNNSATISKTASFVSDGSDGQIYYIFDYEDIDMSGTWQLQVQLNFPNAVLRSNIEKLKVYRNL